MGGHRKEGDLVIERERFPSLKSRFLNRDRNSFLGRRLTKHLSKSAQVRREERERNILSFL